MKKNKIILKLPESTDEYGLDFKAKKVDAQTINYVYDLRNYINSFPINIGRIEKYFIISGVKMDDGKAPLPIKVG